MRKLAQLVAKRAAIGVDAGYTTEGRGTKWFLQWGNGPTVDTMRKHVRAVGRLLPELNLAEVGFVRNYDDHHVVAALLHRATHDEQVSGRWSADAYFQETGFPDDIADGDPLWDLVRYAFAVCGGPATYADDVIDYIARIGVRGLRIEHWLDEQERGTATRDHPPRPPLLDLSMVSEHTRTNLDAAVSAVLRELGGRGPRSGDPRVRVLLAEATRAIVTRSVDRDQREQALLAVADGTPLYRLSQMIGKSASTLRKRWNTAEFNQDLAPLAWLHDHAEEWAQSCADAVAEVRASTDVAEARDVWPLLSRLDRVAQDAAFGWRRLLNTPETARQLLAAVHNAHARRRDDRLLYRSWGAQGPAEDSREPVVGPALKRLAELLAQYDAAPAPQRRGIAPAGRSARPTTSDRTTRRAGPADRRSEGR